MIKWAKMGLHSKNQCVRREQNNYNSNMMMHDSGCGGVGMALLGKMELAFERINSRDSDERGGKPVLILTDWQRRG